MLDPIKQIKEQVNRIMYQAVMDAGLSDSIEPNLLKSIMVETSKQPEYGDFYTNMPLCLVRHVGKPATSIAHLLVCHADISGTYIERMEVHKEGFINIFLKPRWLYDVLTAIIREKDAYGRSDIGLSEKIVMNFNCLDENIILWGDCLANILETVGYDVSREFFAYWNCADTTEYIDDFKAKMRRWGVVLSAWPDFRELIKSSDVKETLEELKIMGYIQCHEDNIWFKADQDEFMLMNGEDKYTDLAFYCAYHRLKIFKEGYDRIIDVWPVEHERLFWNVQTIMKHLGCEAERLEFLPQSGRSIKDEEILRDIEIRDRDVLRFYFSRPSGNVDLRELKKPYHGNPLFDLQYAHARIYSILKYVLDEGLQFMPPEEIDFSLLKQPDELSLIRRLADFPQEVFTSTIKRQPGRLTQYAVDVARLFHRFYDRHRIRISNRDLMYARLGLLEATRIVLANSLYILNIEAPVRV